MQIVIDIPEEVKHKVYAYGLSLCPSDKEQLIHAIMNGTPLTDTLDKIRAEIIEYEDRCHLSDDEYPACKECTNNVFGVIYGILDKYKAGGNQ